MDPEEKVNESCLFSYLFILSDTINNFFFFMLVGNENKVTLTREVSLIRERLRAIEAESGFLKHAAMTLQRDGEGTKLLTEIAEHLRRLRQSIDSPSKDANA